MAEEKRNTQGNPQLVNSFVKGMLKDTTDVFVPEGVWFNAINAINNAHNGEVGAIGNEQSNLECSTFPYAVIGIINKSKGEWVVFSTDNVNSEIGIFNEADCSYKTLVNDTCLNFSTFNLITGAVKENYDCSHSVYWQDNLNPDRVMNLDPDKIPYICFPETVNVDKKWYNYTVTKALPENPCGTALSISGGGIGTDTFTIAVGPTFGLVTLSYCSFTFEDRFVVTFDGVDVIDTGCVATGGGGGGPAGVGPGTRCSSPTTATFMKSTLTETATVTVYGGCDGDPGTVWDFLLSCPDASAPDTPPMPVVSTGIYYINVDNELVELESLDYGQSVTICALENSLDITNIAEGYSVSEPGDICKEFTEIIVDPASCGAECCTSQLDCDALRLHPLVQQPCVRINKSLGSGQLNNGSYQAVIAYSENGIKLTDYSMPSNIQSLWDHTGLGGSLDITVDNLDPNFEEYELVVISTINQQSVAKKIGYYSITQNKVHLDLYNASLITVDLSLIPLKKVIYEKSEKMFDINGYLIRSAVTTQPFFNYQPLANLIQVNWVAVEYPASYYWDGGNETGYYRDEVYSFFIRWVYKTGARSASFHIPGRASKASDLIVLPITNPDLIDNTRRKVWQVYDTSLLTSTSSEERPDGGIIIARGEMAYWESTELYPNQHPEIWGDLCNQPIRHHKMPSNETIHIHDTTGSKINILGVEFSNIKHPLNNEGVPIEDIVGYEILRGSREGNRSILAKGIFNNMIQYDINSSNNVKGLFQNYPYNDVSSDPFLKSNNNLIVKQDIFSFHAPENNLVKPYVGSGGHIKIYTEELGVANIQGVIPYRHPKFKFIGEGAFTASAVFATGLALLTLFGAQSVAQTTTGHTTIPPTGEVNTNIVPWTFTIGVGSGFGTNAGETSTVARAPQFNFDTTTQTTSSGGLGNISGAITSSAVYTGISAVFSGGGTTASVIAMLATLYTAISAANTVFSETLQKLIDILYSLIKYRDYVVQLNSHAFYNSFSSVANTNVPSLSEPSIIRPLVPQGAKYVSSGLQDFNSTQKINNLNRSKFLAIQTATTIPFTTNIDDSKTLIDDGAQIDKIYQRNTSSYYGAIKVNYQNQYGQLQAIVQVPTNSCVYKTNKNVLIPNSTLQIFGGDVYINRYTEKNCYYFFNTWLTDVPDGTEWNYNNYINGPTPVYWLNSVKFDSTDFDISLSFSTILPELDFGTPNKYYDLDERFIQTTGALLTLSFYNAWMYLFYNGVRDFFTESELNVAYRDYGEEPWEKFYDAVGNSFTDLETMFRSDIITKPVYYEYDLSLSASKLYSNFASWGNILPRDYEPTLYTSCFQYYPKRVVYSLQQQEGLKRDNWRNYLQNNYRDFNGKISTIKTLNAQGAIILYEDVEPTMFVGVDTLQTQAGVKFTIGDAGLFQQNMQSIINADDAFEYGTCISSKSAVNTPYGLFWVSQETGKVINYSGGGMNEISKDGMKYWFLENLPSTLLKKYPDFPLYDNVIEGISVQTVFDSQYDLLYITKKDYKPTKEFDDIANCLVYVNGEGFYINESLCNNAEYVYNCPAGYTYNSISGVCEKNVVTSVCDLDGFVFNPETGFCENDNVDPIEISPALSCSEDCILDIEENTCTCVLRAPAVLGPVLTKINIKDFLEEVRWTISYDPKLKIWLSFHDWHPEWMIPSYNHFFTIKSDQSIIPICPPGYTFDPNLVQCVKDVSTAELAQVIISEVPVNIVQDSSPCLLDIVLSIDTSASTGGPSSSIGTAMINFVNTFVTQFTAEMDAGNVQIGLVSWSSSAVDLMPNGFKMGANSSVDYGALLAANFLMTGTDVIDGLVAANNILANPVGSELGNRSALPNYKRILVLLTDTESFPGTNVGCPYQFTTIPNQDLYACFIGPGPAPNPSYLLEISCNQPSLTFEMTPATASDVSNEIQSNICILPPICNCPPGYTLIGECNEVILPICKKVTCKCPTVCEPGATSSTIGVCDDVLYAGNPGYVNPDPLICLSSYTSVKEPSNLISKIWHHNVRTDSFANYYGEDYPWEIEYSVITPNAITTLRNFEYTLDVYKYYNNGKDFNHILDENFDRAVIYNSEQNSGLLKLNLKTKNSPLTLLTYPVVNIDSIDIQFSKEENKFRFNQFYDITSDRGEFTNNTIPMWITDADGYHKTINPAYVDYNKSPLEHKKFRHYGNKIILRKNISNDKKMILKLVNNKYQISPR
jgi:hypothetical protein